MPFTPLFAAEGVCVGKPAPDKTLGEFVHAVAAFASEAKIAAWSIGIEYLASLKKLVITLGYRDEPCPAAEPPAR